MLYDDDTSLKELTNSLFKFQYCFVHPYEPGVFVLHTLLTGIPVFVMVHLLHYLGKISPTNRSLIIFFNFFHPLLYCRREKSKRMVRNDVFGDGVGVSMDFPSVRDIVHAINRTCP